MDFKGLIEAKFIAIVLLMVVFGVLVIGLGIDNVRLRSESQAQQNYIKGLEKIILEILPLPGAEK